MLIFFIVFVVVESSYDWGRLHRCTTREELFETVADYSTNFPCIDCRKHFLSLIEIHPYQLDNVKSRDDIAVWTWMTHNLVNVRLDKPWESFDVMHQYNVANIFSKY